MRALVHAASSPTACQSPPCHNQTQTACGQCGSLAQRELRISACRNSTLIYCGEITVRSFNPFTHIHSSASISSLRSLCKLLFYSPGSFTLLSTLLSPFREAGHPPQCFPCIRFRLTELWEKGKDKKRREQKDKKRREQRALSYFCSARLFIFLWINTPKSKHKEVRVFVF